MLGLNPVTGRLLWKTAVGIHRNGDLPKLTGPTTVLPGTYGGVLTPPASASGVVYAAALNAPDTLEPDHTAYFGGKIGTMDGDIVAMSARTGKIAWDTKVPGDPTGGVTIVEQPRPHGDLSGRGARPQPNDRRSGVDLPRSGRGQRMDVRRRWADLSARRIAGTAACLDNPARSIGVRTAPVH